MPGLTAQLNLDFWGHWFFNARLDDHTVEEMDDAETTYLMGGEL